MGFTRRKVDSNLYYIFVEIDLCILMLYIDELFMMGAYKCIARRNAQMVGFKMKDIGMFIISWVWRFGKDLGTFWLDSCWIG